MPRRALRTRSKARVFIRTPGGKVVIHYRKRKSNPKICPLCKKEIHGIPKMNSSNTSKFPLSSKRISRIYGGVLCGKCLKNLLKKEVAKTWLLQ